MAEESFLTKWERVIRGLGNEQSMRWYDSREDCPWKCKPDSLSCLCANGQLAAKEDGG